MKQCKDSRISTVSWTSAITTLHIKIKNVWFVHDLSSPATGGAFCPNCQLQCMLPELALNKRAVPSLKPVRIHWQQADTSAPELRAVGGHWLSHLPDVYRYSRSIQQRTAANSCKMFYTSITTNAMGHEIDR